MGPFSQSGHARGTASAHKQAFLMGGGLALLYKESAGAHKDKKLLKVT